MSDGWGASSYPPRSLPGSWEAERTPAAVMLNPVAPEPQQNATLVRIKRSDFQSPISPPIDPPPPEDASPQGKRDFATSPSRLPLWKRAQTLSNSRTRLQPWNSSSSLRARSHSRSPPPPMDLTAEVVRAKWTELSAQERKRWHTQQRASTFRRARERATQRRRGSTGGNGGPVVEKRSSNESNTQKEAALLSPPAGLKHQLLTNASPSSTLTPKPGLVLRGRAVVGRVLHAVCEADRQGEGVQVQWFRERGGKYDEVRGRRNRFEYPVTTADVGAHICASCGSCLAVTPFAVAPCTQTPRTSTAGAVRGSAVAGRHLELVPPKTATFIETPRWYLVPAGEEANSSAFNAAESRTPVATGGRLQLMQRHVGWRVRVAYTALGGSPSEEFTDIVAASPSSAGAALFRSSHAQVKEQVKEGSQAVVFLDPSPISSRASEAAVKLISPNTSQLLAHDRSHPFGSSITSDSLELVVLKQSHDTMLPESTRRSYTEDFPGVDVWENIRVSGPPSKHPDVPSEVPPLCMPRLRVWQTRAQAVLKDKLDQEAAKAKLKEGKKKSSFSKHKAPVAPTVSQKEQPTSIIKSVSTIQAGSKPGSKLATSTGVTSTGITSTGISCSSQSSLAFVDPCVSPTDPFAPPAIAALAKAPSSETFAQRTESGKATTVPELKLKTPGSTAIPPQPFTGSAESATTGRGSPGASPPTVSCDPPPPAAAPGVKERGLSSSFSSPPPPPPPASSDLTPAVSTDSQRAQRAEQQPSPPLQQEAQERRVSRSVPQQVNSDTSQQVQKNEGGCNCSVM